MPYGQNVPRLGRGDEERKQRLLRRLIGRGGGRPGGGGVGFRPPGRPGLPRRGGQPILTQLTQVGAGLRDALGPGGIAWSPRQPGDSAMPGVPVGGPMLPGPVTPPPTLQPYPGLSQPDPGTQTLQPIPVPQPDPGVQTLQPYPADITPDPGTQTLQTHPVDIRPDSGTQGLAGGGLIAIGGGQYYQPSTGAIVGGASRFGWF